MSCSDFRSMTSAWIGVRDSGWLKPVTPALSLGLRAVICTLCTGAASCACAAPASARTAAASGVREERKRWMEAIELFQSDGRGTESGNGDEEGPCSATASLREDYLGPTTASSTWPLVPGHSRPIRFKGTFSASLSASTPSETHRGTAASGTDCAANAALR